MTNSSPILLATKSVTLKYDGNTPLTIDPPVGTISTLSKGSTIQIDKSDEANEFSANGSVIATIYNRSDVDQVEIKGGNSVPGTSPFVVTVKLT